MTLSARIPARLEALPTSVPSPPAVSRQQELPFDKLDWKNFERLCVRLARSRSDVEDCREYGVQGDGQEGIDLYARSRTDPHYLVYQCKRQQEFGPAKIKSAVDLFIAGDWRQRAKEFYLCSMESFAPRLRSDALRGETERLESLGIKLVPWDAPALNGLLKDLPEVVDDFFGRPWTELFCGVEAVARLGERLDGAQRAELRQRFARLYFTIFSRDDVNFPFRDPSTSATEALVLPDLLTDENVVAASTISEQTTPSRRPEWPGGEGGEEATLASPPPQSPERVEQRSPASDWIAAHTSVTIVGDPGSGKSTLLRVVALDLLSDTPQLEALSHRFGRNLPVWIPFAHWTALLSQGGAAAQVPVFDVVANWLRLHDEAELIPLVTRAQKEGRLVLLVDGLDEWQTLQGASNALALLEVFATTHDVPVIVTCRPRALELLGRRPANWSVARIAPLSHSQQELLAERILQREMLASDHTIQELAADRARAFLKDIQSRQELFEISRTPLLLGLLAQLWHRDERLPENRFSAYGRMVGLLVETHPSRRMRAARIDLPTIRIEDLRRALGALALAVLIDHSAGIISRDDAARLLERYFRDDEEGVGLPTVEARQMTERVLEHAADRAGILVARSPHELGFYHRAILEYLAAEAIATKAPAVQLQTVRERARDPQWHEVIVGLATLTTSRPLVTSIVEEIQATRRSALDKLLTAPLLASIAFSNAGCSPRTAREIADEILDEIEVGNCVPIRERLLEHAVRGLRSSATQEMVRGRVKRWLPRRDTYRERLYRSIARWVPQTDESIACLWRGLHDENIDNVREAAASLLRLGLDTPTLRERVLALAARSPSPQVRAAILDAAIQADFRLTAVARDAITGAAPRGELHLVAIRGRVAAGEQSEGDLVAMLEFAGQGGDLDYRWNGDVEAILAAGWPTSEKLKEVALESLGQRHPDLIDVRIARRVLVRTFVTDEVVAKQLAAEIAPGSHIHDSDIWPLYAEFARDSDLVKAALDAWIPTVEYSDVETHWAARTTRSERAKRAMIAKLSGPWPGWAAKALLEGWGIGDSEVATALRSAVDGSARTACDLAPVLPDILQDQQQARHRLLELLPEAGHRFGFVVSGLGRIRGPAPETDIVSAILTSHDEQSDALGEARFALFEYFADDERVSDIARRDLLGNDDARSVAAVALAAERAPELRPKILDVLGVLPTRLRLMLAQRLDGFAHDAAVAPILAAYPHEWDGSVRAQCAVLHHSLPLPIGTEGAALELLKAEIRKTGVTLEQARSAALAAALHAKRLDVFVEAKEFDGTPVKLRPDWGHRGYNGPFWKEVASNWQLLKSTFGADLFGRLALDNPEMWDALAIAATRSRELVADVIVHAQQRTADELGPNTLRLLVRELPRGTALRDLLLRCISPGAQDTTRLTWWYENPRSVAVELLADTFARDQDTLTLVSPSVPKEGCPPVLPTIALTIGWPDCTELDRLFVYLRDNNIRFPDVGYGSVVATKSKSGIVMKVLANYDDYSSRLRSWELRIVTRLFLRRLRMDDEVYDQALATRKDLSGPNLVALLRLLAAARGPGDVRSMMEEVTERELNGSVAPMIVRDPFTGAMVTASNLLLEALLGL
jgi:hypothetical protein